MAGESLKWTKKEYLQRRSTLIDIRPQNSEYTERFLFGGPNVGEISVYPNLGPPGLQNKPKMDEKWLILSNKLFSRVSYTKDWVCAKFHLSQTFLRRNPNFSLIRDPPSQKKTKKGKTGEIFKNRPVTPFLVTIGGIKSIAKRELPQFPKRAQLMSQTRENVKNTEPGRKFHHSYKKKRV